MTTPMSRVTEMIASTARTGMFLRAGLPCVLPVSGVMGLETM